MILNDYVSAVKHNEDKYIEANDYYEGNVFERFNVRNSRLRKALSVTGHRGTQNYCRIVVDCVLNRLEVSNVLASTKKAQEIVNKVIKNNSLDLEFNEIHRRALSFGDCYVLVWPDEDGEWRISYNSPLTTAIAYNPERPWEKDYAVKMWVTERAHSNNKGKTRMNVYKKDVIEKYVTNSDVVTDGSNWTFLGSEENPFGEIPVFHFRTHRPFGSPEHLEGYGAQDDINKLLATHMYTVDYQGAPQRYALAAASEGAVDFDDDETARENIGGLKASPGDMWFLNGVDKVGEFKPADPKVFTEPIKGLKESLAALTDTPFHYLERGMAGISGGEGLRVAEAPLLKKVADRQVAFGVTWVEVFQFILKVERVAADIDIKWNLVESLDALGQWDVMLKKINAGLSHRQALREAGYEEVEIEKIMAERAQEAAEGAYYTRKPEARVSTNDNETFENRNGKTEQSKDNGGRGEGDN